MKLLMNLKNWLRAQYPSLFSDEPETVVLENKICNLFQEVRKKEETILPRMSADFDKRLLNLLEAVPLDKQQSIGLREYLREWMENRSVQYSLSAIMVVSLVFVVFGRYNQQTNIVSDSAGVVIEENTSYLNEPTSIDLSESYQKRVLVDRLKSAPNSVYGLRELELYYEKTGRGQAASEIRYLINSIED